MLLEYERMLAALCRSVLPLVGRLTGSCQTPGFGVVRLGEVLGALQSILWDRRAQRII